MDHLQVRPKSLIFRMRCIFKFKFWQKKLLARKEQIILKVVLLFIFIVLPKLLLKQVPANSGQTMNINNKN
jgi:hypothetical protein